MKDNLQYKPIDFDKHSELCIKFRADSFMASFGTDEPFFEEDASGKKYIEWLQGKIGEFYQGIHIWLNEEIIGQIEVGKRSEGDDFGYVNLYYLIPEYRGKGLAKYLEEFSIEYFKSLGYKKAKLSVSPTNKRAVKFYTKNGWEDLGERKEPGRLGKGLGYPVHYMEKVFDI